MPIAWERTTYLILFGLSSVLRLEAAYNVPVRPLPKTTHTPPGRPAFGAPVLIEHIGSVLPQIFYVRTDRHLAQLDEIAVLLIVDFRSRPRDTCAPGQRPLRVWT